MIVSQTTLLPCTADPDIAYGITFRCKPAALKNISAYRAEKMTGFTTFLSGLVTFPHLMGISLCHIQGT